MKPSDIDAHESIAHGSSRPLPLKHLQRYGLAILTVGVGLGAALLLQHFHFRDAVFPLLLFAVAISSWYGGPGPAVLAVILSTVGFDWFFVEPVRSLYIYWSEVAYFIIFAAFAVLISWFSRIRQRVEEDLHERAALLDLTHDTVFVMDIEGVIKYWNRAASERYGWSAEQAVGRVVHDLLKTVFPVPLEQTKAEARRAGRWEGELLHTKKDGTRIVVASRWALQRNRRGAPVEILETNNDVTERKRAEEALSRLNRELRALSNCNQALLRATDEQSLLEEICRIVCAEAGYRMAWIAYAEHDEAKSVRPLAWTGAEGGYLANLGITWADTERGRSPTGTAIRSGKTCCIQDLATDPRLASWRESVLQHGFLSGIALPLKDEHGSAFGSLSIYSAHPNAFTPEEIRLLEELAGDLAFGIVTLRSRAARKRAEEALRESEANFNRAQEVAHIGSWHLDIARNQLSWSDEVFRIFDRPRGAALTYEAFLECIHPEDRERVDGAWAAALQGAPYDIEHRILVGDQVKWLREKAEVEFDPHGKPVEGVGTVQDITERKGAEEALRLASAYNRSLIEASLDPLVTVGPDGKITDVNAATEAATGCSRGELIGTDFCNYFTEPAQARAGYEQVFREGKVRDYPLELRHRDGHVMSVLYNAAVYRDKLGKVIGVFAAARDITERKQVEDALRRSEAYLAETQRLSHTGSWAFDLAIGEFVYASEECFRMYEMNPREALPTREATFQVIHPEDRAGVQAGFEKSLREKVDTSSEFRLVLPSGAVKRVQAIRHPVLNDAGEVIQLVGTTIDITQRKRAEEALRESERYLAEAQRLSHTGSWAFDLASNEYVYVSEECARIFELDAQENLRTREVVSRLIHPEDWESANEGFEKSVQEKVDTLSEFRIALPSGTAKHVQAIRHPVLNEAGDVVKVVGTVIDITERKHAEEALRSSETERRRAAAALQEARAELERVSRVTTMGALTASIAHEVNQPLAGLVASANAGLNWLAANPPNLSKTREALERVLRDGTRAGEVLARIRGLLKRTPSGKALVSVNQIVKDVLALTAGELRGRHIQTELVLDPDPPTVLGDAIQLQQVLLNLITNAIEAMAAVLDGRRTLGIQSSRGELEGRPAVVVAVSDTGIGLGSADVAQLFEAFHTTKPQGMGMGLWISRSIVEEHGGRLTAQNDSGPGATFVLTIPVAHAIAEG